MKMRRVPETHKGPAPLMRGLFLSPRGVVTTARVCVCSLGFCDRCTHGMCSSISLLDSSERSMPKNAPC